MPYLLDTNAAIALMKGQALLRQVQRVGRSQLRLCAPVEGELWFGVAKSLKVEENRTRLLTLLGWLPVTLYHLHYFPSALREAHGSALKNRRPWRSAPRDSARQQTRAGFHGG